MIVVSLLLILVAVTLLVLGLVGGSSTLLISSIVASLLAAVALVIGARQAAARRRQADPALAGDPSARGGFRRRPAYDEARSDFSGSDTILAEEPPPARRAADDAVADAAAAPDRDPVSPAAGPVSPAPAAGVPAQSEDGFIHDFDDEPEADRSAGYYRDEDRPVSPSAGYSRDEDRPVGPSAGYSRDEDADEDRSSGLRADHSQDEGADDRRSGYPQDEDVSEDRPADSQAGFSRYEPRPADDDPADEPAAARFHAFQPTRQAAPADDDHRGPGHDRSAPDFDHAASVIGAARAGNDQSWRHDDPDDGLSEEFGEADDDDPADEPLPQAIRPGDAVRVARLDAEVLVVDGRPRYHVADCRHLVGRLTEALPVSEAVELGFSPCGLCRPVDRLVAQAAHR
jgi:hypothetical protein